MNELTLELLESNDNSNFTPVTLTGDDGLLVSRYVDISGLSISDEKVAGLDNLQIEARRLKASIRLPHLMTTFRDEMTAVFSDTNRLISDNLRTQSESVFLIRHDDAMAHFSINELFGRDYHYPTYNSWSGNASGYLFVQSERMYNIFYRYISNFFLDEEITAFYQSPAIDGVSAETRLNHYPFDLLTSFLQKGFIKESYWSGAQEDGSTMADNITIGLYFIIDTILQSDASSSFSDYWIANLNTTRKLWLPVKSSGWQSNESAWSLAAWQSFVGWLRTVDTLIVDWNNDAINLSDISYTDAQILAYFFASIVRRSWFDDVRNIFKVKQECVLIPRPRMQTNNIVLGGYFHCCNPFHYCPETILGRHVGEAILDNEMADIALQVDYTGATPIPATILCVKQSQDDEVPVEIGVSQTATFTETTDDGILIDDASLPLNSSGDDGLYYPVRRLYEFMDNTYWTPSVDKPDLFSAKHKYVLDNIREYDLYQDPLGDSYLYMCQFPSKNFMYFDNIKCVENYITKPITGYDYTNDNKTQNFNGASYYWHPFTENYICFDEQGTGDVDEYSRFMYADFVNKYYEKSKCSLMNLYVRLKLDGITIYTGIVDYTSVTMSHSEILFEATDAIGAMITNLNKLSGFINFAQFDIGDGVTANTDSGCTIYSALTSIIRNQYPYKTAFPTSGFSFPLDTVAIHNKALQDISTEDALLIGLQAARQVLYATNEGRIEFASVLGTDTSVTIDNRFIIESTTSKEINMENFSIDKLQYIAGYRKFAPAIFAYFSQLNKKYRDRVSLTLFGYNNIRILNRIVIDSVTHVVVNIARNLFNSKTSVNTIKLDE